MWLRRASRPWVRSLCTGYDAAVVEERWRPRVLEEPPASGGAPFYCLAMFPYPSGQLHMGHVRVYAISDAVARFEAARGRAVLHPMGWDAFGLPAENAALERARSPDEWTRSNVAAMRAQMDRLGLRFHWSRQVDTSSPAYYRWTQWLFLQLHRHGLVYAKLAAVNWDPVDRTVLANEQVDALGRSWRSGARVERRTMRQWFVRTTAYAAELLDAIDSLHAWPDLVRSQQRHWIGRSDGADVRFELERDREPELPGDWPRALDVFTTRPDTLYGASFVAVPLDAPLVDSAAPARLAEVRAAAAAADARRFASPADREAREPAHLLVLDGVYARHPLTGLRLPVVAADYVLSDYGRSAVMGVPAHDERDAVVARLLGLPAPVVVRPPPGAAPSADAATPYTGAGTAVNSGPFDGLETRACADAIIAELKRRGLGAEAVTYRLRDWLVSRQRYWGTPIPIVHCKSCGEVPVPEDQLPVVLPIEGVPITGRGGSPLSQCADFARCTCPRCGAADARRETDTMDTFVDSSWYYARYPDAHNPDEYCGAEARDRWLPVQLYIGGSEHAILHLLYARFINRFLHNHYGVPTAEPFASLLTQGMVVGQTFRLPGTGECVPSSEVVRASDGSFTHPRSGGCALAVSYEKMSKSKHNGVSPQDIVERFGADAARLFTLFKAPPDLELEWEEQGIVGQQRWLQRLWRMSADVAAQLGAAGNPGELPAEPTVASARCRQLLAEIHSTIEYATRTFSSPARPLNTVVAALMKLSNALSERVADEPLAAYHGLRALTLMLAPMAPHISAELWDRLRRAGSVAACARGWAGDDGGDIFSQRWPEALPQWQQADDFELVVQISGRKRASCRISSAVLALPSSERDAALSKAALSTAAASLSGRSVTRVVISPHGRLVNLVVSN